MVDRLGQRSGFLWGHARREAGGPSEPARRHRFRDAGDVDVQEIAPRSGVARTAQLGSRVPSRGETPRPQAIDDLRALSSNELASLFRGGEAPDIGSFSGEMRGAALAAPFHDDTTLGRFVSWFAKKAFFPWAGKVALTPPVGTEEGTGKNRILGVLLCPFRFGLVDSKFDAGEKVIRLDYATPSSLLNKVTGIAAVHDELREVGDGVLLGMAGLTYEGPVSSFLFNALLKLAGRKERVKEGGEVVPIIYFALAGHPEAAA